MNQTILNIMKNKTFIFFSVLFAATFFFIHSCKKDDACTEQTWYRDFDADSYGDSTNTSKACDKPDGYVADKTDFNDSSAVAYPGATEICNDGVDNDGNGFVDSADFFCDESLNCNDGIDNDGNGFIDCNDFQCANTTVIECNCSDGTDNDSDGFTDCNDIDCNGKPGC
jgi:hypothetical protein